MKNTQSKQHNRLHVLLKHISPNVHFLYSTISQSGTQNTQNEEMLHDSIPLAKPITTQSTQIIEPKNKSNKKRERKKIPPNLLGFPHTTVKANLFSRVMEKIYSETKQVIPETDLVEMPKGEAPPVNKVFAGQFKSGHVCIVGPTGSGKSTIVRGILKALTAENTLAIYSLESPVEVNLNTHGLFNVSQIDMFQEIQGKQRSLADTANALLKHDPDIIYFGELRHKVDFETATSIALSGVAVISTGHASSPLDLLERLKSMNIDLKTQFRAFKCILGVKRVPILCENCKRQVVLYGQTNNRALQLLNLYRTVTFSKAKRRQVLPIVCMPAEPGKNCNLCTNGYVRNHTIFEYLYVTPDSTMESLRKNHTYTTEETLVALILEGSVNPLYLESFL